MSISTPQTELPRDRWGRPLISPPDGRGEPVAYTRATTFAGTLEDTYNLTAWGKRMVAKGMAQAPDLQIGAVAADPDDKYGKKTLNEIAEKAIERAKGSAAATTGTALHALTERIDLGLDLGYVPEAYLPDLDAYKQVILSGRLEPREVEQFCVLDAYKVGGTYDRLYGIPDDLQAPDGTFPGAEGLAVIGDVKSGNIEFGGLKMGVQLSVYANSVKYDHRDGARSLIGGDGQVSKSWGIIVHLPAGTGTASLHWVDLARAAETFDTIKYVRDLRSGSKDFLSRFSAVSSGVTLGPTLAEQLRAATTLEELRAVNANNKVNWTPGLTSLARDLIRQHGWS